MSKPAAPPEQLGLFAAVVGGLVSRALGGPAARDEVSEQPQGPAVLELPDDVDHILVGVELVRRDAEVTVVPTKLLRECLLLRAQRFVPIGTTPLSHSV